MRAWVKAVGLTRIILVCQDWGSLIGLRLVAEHPEWFARVVVANGGLPTGDQEMPEAFNQWRAFSRDAPELPVGRIIDGGTVTNLAPEVIAAYDAPFPDEKYKACARIFPSLVPATPDDPAAGPNRKAWRKLMRFDRPFLTAFSDGDPITAGAQRAFQRLIPGAKGREHPIIEGAGHFLQEDKGPELARVVLEFMNA
jgi:haloalkane dehalogenase